ncbi:MAG TPA: glycoside hydrolase family 25 protein [Methylomicrobium sp.]|nr:glycoside hydrolase family 25 protein [Methylomicrobium sp.]
MLWVIDAHTEYQSGLNVPSLKAEGYSAIIVKATEGFGYTAPGKFDTWISQARSVGLIPGAYHWLNSSDPVGQANRYLDRIGNPEGMICAVDVEDTGKGTVPSYNHLVAFANQFYSRTNGHPLLIYSGAWWWQPRGWNGVSISPYLWDSHYVSGYGAGSVLYQGVDESWWNGRYGGWPRVTLLQFSSKCSAGGITAGVDVSAFAGTEQELRSLAYADKNSIPMSTQDGEIEMFMAKTDNDATVVLTDGATWCVPLDAKTFNNLKFVPMADGVSDEFMARLRKLPVIAGAIGLTDTQVSVIAGTIAAALSEAVDATGIQSALEGALSKVRLTVN